MKNIIDYTEAIKDYVNEAVESGGGVEYLDQEVTLQTDNETQVTFTSNKITPTSAIQVFNSEGTDLYYESLEILDGAVIVTFLPQPVAKVITVRIYIM